MPASRYHVPPTEAVLHSDEQLEPPGPHLHPMSQGGCPLHAWLMLVLVLVLVLAYGVKCFSVLHSLASVALAGVTNLASVALAGVTNLARY